MNTFMLALRNLLRNKRRSLTTLLAMIIGLVATLIFGGYRLNVAFGMETGFVQSSGHLQIERKGYFIDGGDNPTAYGFSEYEKIISAIKQDPELASMVVAIAPRLQLGGLAGNFAAGISRSVIALGVVVPEHNKMLSWNDYEFVDYASPRLMDDSQPDSVVIGEGVARKLGLCQALHVGSCYSAPTSTEKNLGASVPSDIAALSALEPKAVTNSGETNIELLAATARGAPNVASLKVLGTKNMGVKALDDMFVAMHLAQAQKLIYGAASPKVTAIAVQLKHTKQLPQARKRLQHILDTQFGDQSLEILDFAELNPIYGQSMQFMDSMFGFISVLIGVIVLFTIGNTMSTAVVERTVEIGTLRAMGLSRGGLRKLFLCEGLLLGVIGSVIGVIIASVVAYAINHSGLEWMPPGWSYSYFILVLLWQEPSLVIVSVLSLIFVALVSALLPANRASRLMIVDALRHV